MMSRRSALIVIDEAAVDNAMSRTVQLLDGLLKDPAGQAAGHGPYRRELYAAAEAASLKRELSLPNGRPDDGPYATSIGTLHYIWSEGNWFTPASCPPAPPEDNGASAW